MTRIIVFSVLCLAVFATLAQADPWIGQKVYWRDGARLMFGDQEVAWDRVPAPAVVQKVENNWLWIGQAWLRESDALTVDQKLELDSEAIRRQPRSPALWASRGNEYNEKGQFDDAIRDFNQAIELDPRLQRAWLQRGIAWQGKGQYQSALQDYCELANWRVAGWIDTLAASYAEKGDYDAAVKWATKAAALEPATSEFQDHLALFQSHKPLREAAK
jgi:tetratricopeptide (TPR) repeat protein